MINAPWEKVKDLLDSAIELRPEQRSEYLDQNCPDGEVRRSVETLIESYEESANFLEKPAVQTLVEQDLAWPGRILGSYKVLDEIGSGGMGAVFRATRVDDEFHQTVAIKIINGVFVSKQLVDRFRAERQILANLNHPNIARLIDGGTTPEGLPYLIMEYVEGKPIDEYCDAHRLPLRERLELFLQLCAAVQYAHQNLTVHRDLKPGNVLVTAEGVPKLLDFGIAKILQPTGQSTSSTPAPTLQAMMTPEYASPEQLQNKVTTTASDVYSLGIVLYLLLTGRSRHMKSSNALQGTHAIDAEAPLRPSVAVARTESVDSDKTTVAAIVTQRRAQSIYRLRKELAGDLDAIVLKSLENEPARRYGSAEHFAEDIRRYLGGRPVHAHLPSLSYRVAKFARRHVVAVAATIAVAIASVVAVALIVRAEQQANRQRARAEQRFNDVRTLANSLMFDVHDSIKDLPGATPARKILIDRALQYLDSLARESSGDPSLQRELAAAYERVGDVQGQFATENLGLPQAALDSYRKALTIRSTLVTADPRDLQNQRQLATSYGKVGSMEWLIGDPKSAAETARRELEVSQAISAADPSNRSDRKLLATSYLDYGWKQAAGLGDYPAGIASCRQAITLLENLLQQDPGDKDSRTILATAYSRVGMFLEELSRFPESLSAFQTAAALRGKLLSEDPASAKNRRNAASSEINIGNVLAEMNDAQGALPHQRKALAAFEALARDDPKNMQLRQDRAGVLGNMGSLLTTTGDFDQAKHSLQEALNLLFSLPAANSSVVVRFTVAKDQYRMGKALVAQAEKTTNPAARKELWRDARSWFEKSLPAFTDLRDRKVATGPEAAMPDEVAKEISNCDKALRR